MRVAFLGATRGMGRALARRMAERGDRLFLLGRREEELERSARDLAIRAGGDPVGHARCDLLEPEGFAPALEAAESALGGLDAVVVTAALFYTQEALESDPERARALCVADFAHTVALCERAREPLLRAGGGTLCVFGSVAGDRARRPAALYGAAKAGLAHYLDGLDLRYRERGLRTVCVKPGFVRTGMTEGLPAPPFAGEPERVAKRVLRALDRGQRVVYAPAVWRWILLAVRALPRAVLRRTRF